MNDIVTKIKSSEKCHTPMMVGCLPADNGVVLCLLKVFALQVRSEVKSLLSMVTKLSSEGRLTVIAIVHVLFHSFFKNSKNFVEKWMHNLKK